MAARLQRADLAEILRERVRTLGTAIKPATEPAAATPGRAAPQLLQGPTHFAGLKYGDTLEQARPLFGPVKNRDRRLGNQFFDRTFWVRTDAAQRITHVCVFQHSVPYVAKHAGADALLNLIGRTQADLVAALGPPASTQPGIEPGMLILAWPFQIEGRLGAVGAGVDKHKNCYGVWLDWPPFP